MQVIQLWSLPFRPVHFRWSSLYVFYNLFLTSMHFTALQTNIQLFYVLVPDPRVKFVCQVQSPCRAMRMSLCPSIWRSRWAADGAFLTCDTRPWQRATHNQAVIEHLLHQKQGTLGWKLKEESKDVWISKYRWRKKLAPVGMVKHCDYSYNVYDIWTFMMSAAAGILFINRTTTGPTTFWCLYCILIIAFQCLLGFCGMFLCNQLQHHYY